MSDFIFSNSVSGNPSLYLAAFDNGWCAFLLPKGVTPVATDITLDASQNQSGGYYLFAATTPTMDGDTLANKAWDYFQSLQQPYQWGAIVWLDSPDQAFSAANTQMLTLLKQTQGFSVLTEFNYSFGNNFASLYISNINSSITIDVLNNKFIVGLAQGASPNIKLTANSLKSQTQVQSNLEIPLSGIGRGRMRFILGLNCGTDYIAFDIAQKYFYSAQQQLIELSYPPLISGSLNDLALVQTSIYPFDLLNAKGVNTYMAFLGQTLNTNTQQKNPTQIASYFRADYGYPFDVIPVCDFSSQNGSDNFPGPDCSLLVFSERKRNDPNLSWYSVPSGCFTLAIDADNAPYLDSNGQMRLICGLAGTESISLTPQTSTAQPGDRLRFFPGNNAYVPQFPITAAGNSVGSNTTQQWLANTCITAWAGVALANPAGTAVVYHAQPQGASLYAPGQDAVTGDQRFLGYYPAGSGTLSAATTPLAFPMVAYGNKVAVPDGTNANQFEAQILNPARKNAITTGLQDHMQAVTALRASQRLTGSTAATATLASTSPQGFYVEVEPATSVWDVMQLASNQFKQNDGSLSPIYNLAFKNLGTTLQAAFQSQQLFLVISCNRNNVLGEFEHEMLIEGWPFIIDVPTSISGGNYNNVLIFKFCDSSLLDRVKNIQFWNMPDQFNDTSNAGLPNVSSWLVDYIQQGIDKFQKNGDGDFAKFFDVATNPSWQGVLALNVDISLQDFPADLQGLLAGIDLDRFAAHHFGIDQSTINNDGGQLSMPPTSSLFALINYEDAGYAALGGSPDAYQKLAPINASVDYVFTVLTLKIAFANSKITNFNSYIALTVNKLFDEKVDSSNRQNLLILTGTYEQHNGAASYTFNTTGNSLLYLKSAAIQDVEILKAGFNTLIPQDPKDSDGNVYSTFSFWGNLNFNLLEGFDLLSFGNEPGVSPNGCGIAFSNLSIDLVFPLATPTTKTFAFDIDHITFDIGQSTPRADSLYRHFPLQLTGMAQGDGSNTPTGTQGYLNVLLPSLQQQQGLSGKWYGLTFKLNMGTMGALASAAGFNTTLLLGWSAGGSGAAAALKLPGVNPQAPFFSLQGVLRMDIGAIELRLADADDASGTAYLMKINNVALNVLSLTFPPGGNVGFYLFGNPDQTAPPESLGWYAAYKKK